MAKQVGYLLLLLALTYFVTMGGGMYGVFEFRLGLLSHLLALSLLLGYGFWKLRQGRLLPRTPLDLPILGFLSVSLVSTILSRDARLSAENLLYLSVLVLVYYISVDVLSHGWPFLLTIKAILTVGAVVLLLAVLELLAWYFGLLHLFIPGGVPDIGWWAVGGLSLPPTLYRLHVVLSNSNALAWFLALLMPVAVSQFLATQEIRTKVNLAVWIGLACLVLILTFSRSGFVALATGLLTLGSLYLAKKLYPRRSQVRWAVPVCLIVMVIFAMASLALMPWLIGWRYATVGVRAELWQAAIAIFARYPVLGGGPGTFGYLFHQVADFSPQSADVFFNSAHNAYLSTLSEVGILGLGFGLWLAGALLLAGWRSWHHAADVSGAPISLREQATIAGCLAGLVGLLAMNLTDNNFVFPSVTLVAILYAAVIVRPSARPGKATRNPMLPILAAMIALATLSIDAAHYFYAHGIAEGQREDWIASTEAIAKARDLDPSLTLYRFHWGIAQGYLGLGCDEERLDLAIAEYRDELERGGDYALNLANVAWLEYQAGEMATAVADMERAVALAPVEPGYRLALGFLAEADGDPGKALSEYAQAVALQPTILDYAFWHTSAFRREALEQLPSLALSYLPSSVDNTLTRAGLSYYGGDLEKATTWLEPLSSPQALVLLALTQGKMGDYEAARVHLDRALSLNRGFGPAYLERGRIYLALGQLDLAEEDLRMALFLNIREAHYYLGEIAFQRGRLEDAQREFREGLSWSCSILAHFSYYASDVYHRENLSADFSPSVLKCIPGDRFLPLYPHLVQVYSVLGTSDEAKDICNWLLEFYPPSFLEEKIKSYCEIGDGSL